MKMIVHQAIRVNLPIGFAAGFAQGFNETTAIYIIAEDCLTPITTIHHTRPAVALSEGGW
jgi:hypothetical protein